MPVGPSTNIDITSSASAAGSSQNEMLFMRGNAMSGAPIISGTNQFPNPPIVAGITSAIKCFFGATEIHGGGSGNLNGYFNIHSASYGQGSALYAGELAARYINPMYGMYSPVLYITCAMWSGHESRTGGAVETKAVLACTNPATLDFVAGRDVMGPHNSNLNPIYNNNTRRQIVGCMSGGVGTIIEGKYSVVSYEFSA